MMSSKLAFATILVASYATTAEAAGSCIAKTDNEWAALGLTVDTAAGTDVAGLGAIGAAAGWSEDSTDSAAAVCVGGAALAALTGTKPTITATTEAGTHTGATDSAGGSGSGLVADIICTADPAVTSITVTTAGTGYTIGDTVTFAAVSGNSGHDHPQIDYVLVAADFDAFTASGVTTVSGKCSGNLATATDLAEVAADGTFQYACGSGFTVKASTVALPGGDSAAKKTACCTANAVCTTIACGAGYEQKSNHASLTCAGVACDVAANSNADRTTCCDAVVTTTTAAPTSNTTAAPEPETPATLPDSSASTEITSVIAVVTVIAAALAGL
jgi:hypothetical protein